MTMNESDTVRLHNETKQRWNEERGRANHSFFANSSMHDGSGVKRSLDVSVCMRGFFFGWMGKRSHSHSFCLAIYLASVLGAMSQAEPSRLFLSNRPSKIKGALRSSSLCCLSSGAPR